MKRVLRVAMALALFILTAGAVAAQPSTEPAEPQDGCTFYEETGHNLCADFEAYWDTNGGLPVFGYPITEAAPELNWDLQQEFQTQYFERERMELHPENAGTPYNVLLGRLGNEVLLAMGEDWLTFPKADPSADNYMEATGHAIAPEFIDYWSSHGLDLGLDGVWFQESLALFGYPISEPQMETNSSDDTVLTQWFERARFEFHPDNPAGQQVLLGLLGNELLALQEPSGPPEIPSAGEVLAQGLMQPRGLELADDGSIYVAESGMTGDTCVEMPGPEGDVAQICAGTTGAVAKIANGELSRVATGLPSVGTEEEPAGPSDVIVDAEGNLHVVVGLGADPAARSQFADVSDLFGHLLTITDGDVVSSVDISAYETAANPAGGPLDSNPFSLVMNSDGSYVVSDAGMNALLNVAADGTITTLATFDSQMVDAPPFLGLPEGQQIPMEAVPTGVVMGPDGNYYVGELTGFPFVPGAARVWQVTPEGEATVFAEGFTNVLDVAFDADGDLFVLEMTQGGLLNANPEDLSTAVGAIVKVSPDGTQEMVVSDGIFMATGMDIGPDGSIYVADLSVVPGLARVQKIEGIAHPAPPGPEVVADGLNSPRGIAVMDDGTLYVAEAGTTGDECQVLEFRAGEDPFEVCYGPTSAVTMVADGVQSQVVTGLPSAGTADEPAGAHDVVVGDDGTLYIPVGLGSNTIQRFRLGDAGHLLGHLVAASDGSISEVADIAMYETDNNPAGGTVDSNPYSVVMNDDGSFVVSDAGMNTLLNVAADGTITTLATFDDRMVDAPPFLGLPEGTQIPMQPVPTGVTMGPDGNYYVGELTGFPFVPGAARVWQVTPEGEATVYAEGFTNVIDVAFDVDGNLLVLQMVKGGLLGVNPDDMSTLAAQVTSVAPDGTQTPIASNGLFFATGMAVGPDGSIYVSNYGTMPGMGQVVRLAS